VYNECIYCGGGPYEDWAELRTHLKGCDPKKMVDVNRDEFKSAYGFWPDFDTVRAWIDEVRQQEEKGVREKES